MGFGLSDNNGNNTGELDEVIEAAKKFDDFEIWYKVETAPDSEEATQEELRIYYEMNERIRNELCGKVFKCCLCGKRVKSVDNNPWPLKTRGRCCTECDRKYVTPTRIIAGYLSPDFKRDPTEMNRIFKALKEKYEKEKEKACG